MILYKGEKIHVIHRRHFEKEPARHFIGVVDCYEGGVARVTGNVYVVDPTRYVFVRRPEVRTRVISILSGDLLINVIPEEVDLDAIVYRNENKSVRVTDGTTWYIDISESTWS